jgi:hypothetical protein
MMRRVHVESDPAIFGFIVRGQRVPERGQGPTLWPHRQTEPYGRQPAIDADDRRIAKPRCDQFRGCQTSGTDGRSSKIGNGKDRR